MPTTNFNQNDVIVFQSKIGAVQEGDVYEIKNVEKNDYWLQNYNNDEIRTIIPIDKVDKNATLFNKGGKRRNTRRRIRKSKKTRKSRNNRRKSNRRSRR